MAHATEAQQSHRARRQATLELADRGATRQARQRMRAATGRAPLDDAPVLRPAPSTASRRPASALAVSRPLSAAPWWSVLYGGPGSLRQLCTRPHVRPLLGVLGHQAGRLGVAVLIHHGAAVAAGTLLSATFGLWAFAAVASWYAGQVMQAWGRAAMPAWHDECLRAVLVRAEAVNRGRVDRWSSPAARQALTTAMSGQVINDIRAMTHAVESTFSNAVGVLAFSATVACAGHLLAALVLACCAAVATAGVGFRLPHLRRLAHEEQNREREVRTQLAGLASNVQLPNAYNNTLWRERRNTAIGVLNETRRRRTRHAFATEVVATALCGLPALGVLVLQAVRGGAAFTGVGDLLAAF